MGEALLRARTAVMHRRLEEELDALLGGGLLLDPDALARLRGLIDEALPVAEAYAGHLARLSEAEDALA